MMEAEFFCLAGDAPRAGLLKRLISDYLDPSISLTVHNIQEGPSYERGLLARRYEQLMLASIPPALGLTLSVTTMDWFEYAVYVKIYWPVLTQGYWSEMEGNAAFFEGYEVTRQLSFSYESGGLKPFFPTLAIRDRMVLMPSGQGKLLEQVGSEKSVDVKYDVLEVDFDDDAALDQALRSVAQELQQEIRHELRAYSGFVQGVVDVEKAAVNLGLPPALLAKAFMEEAHAAAAIYQLLSCDLGQKTLIQGRWTRTTLDRKSVV
jgi:hypothetical protein